MGNARLSSVNLVEQRDIGIVDRRGEADIEVEKVRCGEERGMDPRVEAMILVVSPIPETPAKVRR